MKKHYDLFLGLVIVIGLTSCQAKAKDLALESDDAAGYVKRAEAYFELGGAASEKGNWDAVTAYNDKANADFEKAIELEPENIALYNRRGDIYSGYIYNDGNRGASFTTVPRALYSVPEEDRLTKSIDDYTTVIKLQPDDFGMYIKRGMTYREIKKLDEAIADFERAQEVDPKRVEGYYNIATIYRYPMYGGAISDATKAIEYYRKVLKIDPDDGLAKIGLEMIEKDRVKQADAAAAKAKEEAIKKYPSYTTQELSDRLTKGNDTSRDFQRKADELRDKPLLFTGTVDDISDFDDGGVLLEFTDGKRIKGLNVSCYFRAEEAKKLANIKKGQKVRVLGTPEDIGDWSIYYDVTMRRCSLQ
jgi:tetratricopeptide (TPR) repeat protein